MVTVATTEAPPCGPRLESLALIDLAKLSQSELHDLSLCSAAACLDDDDVVSPQIDRSSVFNESAATRRQTFSRLRHPSAAAHRCRLPNPRPLPKLSPHDPEHAENESIVNSLKRLIGSNGIENPLLLPPPPQAVVSGNAEIVPCLGEKKRRRERKPKPNLAVNGGEVELEIVNKNGVVVDFRALENADEFYGAELRRRTVGLESEEGVLGFLRDLEGQWGSRRKRRRIVDACEFGDWLPIGWKLLLGLKRREGRVSVYCRRYVSPSGQQYASCKEASSYLQSYFGLNDASELLNQNGGNNQLVCAVASENLAGFADKNCDVIQDSVPNSALPSSSMSSAQEIEFSLVGIDNLPEVQVRDLFECHKCNLTFDERDPYLEHLMSIHRRTTRRYRLGSSIGEGVIIKDGKYECQICHKVFQERRSYNGHVGVHVRNNIRNLEELPGEASVQKSTESPSQDKLPPRISKMDALIEIAQSSILETSAAEPNDKASDGSSPHALNVVTVPESHAANSDHELSLSPDPKELELEDFMTKSVQDQGFNQHDGMCLMIDKEKVNSGHMCQVDNDLMVDCTGTFEFPKLNGVEKQGNSEQEMGFKNSQLTPSHDVVTFTSDETLKENVIQSGIADSSMPLIQSLHCLPSSTAISNKGENEYCTVDQKLDNVSGFDDLRLEEIEPLKFNFLNGQDSPSLPEVSMNLSNDERMEEGFNSTAIFESEAVMLNIGGRHQFTTVCVWCRTEFNHEAIDYETQSDSVGYMCPSCKAKISGQLNVLDGGLSMNFHL